MQLNNHFCHFRTRNNYEQNNMKMTTQVTQQGIWFIVAFMVTWIPSIIAILLDDILPEPSVIFLACLFPLQGLFNAIVYFRPKYIAERQRMISDSDRRGSRASTVMNTLKIPTKRRSSTETNLSVGTLRRNDNTKKTPKKNDIEAGLNEACRVNQDCIDDSKQDRNGDVYVVSETEETEW